MIQAYLFLDRSVQDSVFSIQDYKDLSAKLGNDSKFLFDKTDTSEYFLTYTDLNRTLKFFNCSNVDEIQERLDAWLEDHVVLEWSEIQILKITPISFVKKLNKQRLVHIKETHHWFYFECKDLNELESIIKKHSFLKLKNRYPKWNYDDSWFVEYIK